MFQKHPDNPIYGGPDTGTLFDVYVTPRPDGRLRMDFSWRTNDTLAVAFSEDGVRWTPPRSALYDPVRDEWRVWYNGRSGSAEYIGTATKQGDFTRADFY